MSSPPMTTRRTSSAKSMSSSRKSAGMRSQTAQHSCLCNYSDFVSAGLVRGRLGDMGEQRVILVSNRGPVQYGREGGERTTTRGAGGLVTALSGLGQHLADGVWICAAMSDEDVAVATESPRGLIPPELGDDDLRVRLVPLDPGAQDDFYTVIANPLLWFIQHHLYDLNAAPNITRR